MPMRHIALAVLVTAIWGFNFVVIRLGLGSVPPLLLAALRFVVAALPVVFLARPNVPPGRMIAVGMTLFVGQFAFLFPAMKLGMPPGLASVTLQSQAFLTILFAALALGERPRPRQLAGAGVAALGLLTIASTVGGDFTMIGLGLTIASAASWALGNVLMRGAGKVDMFAMMVWLSLVPPIPLFALSLAIEGWPAIVTGVTGMGLVGAGSVLYLALLATLVGFGLWGFLLKNHPASTVAPFSLLVPLFGTLSSWLVLGETFSPLRVAGMGLILLGLATIALPLPAFAKRQRAA
ncbi:EamA family transporter [Pleomorphomonas diazotrophica]|uniref:EamA family transporter n=1 Tax=Pleomorphomonas diazotrophica TaxID=1166257 RepID=A0A1I4TDT8_9HYPH|nr:EamA family transporter [Pleomorphomonas diazotrophica]PKR89405.1 EamA family transporter [Pleomorphomonas diazotrophica]SFM74730.1 O-acetylserine/cysteine efflux transporter [Pleomorphomonas diazotrophica]